MCIMGFKAIAMLAFGWTTCSMSKAESGPCPLDTVVINITSAADVQNLTDALACVGQGAFDISWHSSQTIDERIDVSDDKNMTVTGAGFSSFRGAVGDDMFPGVLIDAGSGHGIFSVSNGSTLRLNNIWLEGGNAEDGGAVAVYSSSALFVFGCTFTHNRASTGGALFASDSSIYIDGSTSFEDNSAQDGGAIYAYDSEVHFDGNCSLTNNDAERSGGALYVWYSTTSIKGRGVFANNSAGSGGGAIFASSTNITVTGSNLPLAERSDDEGEFFSLTKTGAGRAIYRSIVFIDNSAILGGAMNLEESNLLHVSFITFESNKAQVGGAIYTAHVEDQLSEVRACVFHENTAVDGGALYFQSPQGLDAVASSFFLGNSAEFSGGAIFHAGVLRVVNTSFVANAAANEGVAIISLGVLEELSNVVFSENSFQCRLGEYSFDVKTEAITVGGCSSCFEKVCARCTDGTDSFADDEGVQVDGEPFCALAPFGFNIPNRGTTLASAEIVKGYYRTSNQSHLPLKCHLPEACVGGRHTDHYCAPGYEGPYCAVCEAGFTSGFNYKCMECPKRKSPTTLLLAGVTLLVALSSAVLLSYLRRVVGDGESAEVVNRQGFWKAKLSSLHKIIDEGGPSAALKITVVVWQIISQFAVVSGNVYPRRYAAFISTINVVNVDFGYLFSFACILRLNFYNRLVLATIGPMVVLLILGCVYAQRKMQKTICESELRVVRDRLVSAATFIMVFVYASTTFTILQTFSCDPLDDGIAYLRADYSISCSTTLYKVYRAYAGVMAGIYTIAIPGFFSWEPQRPTV